MSSTMIEALFQPIYGRPCWGVRYDRQLNLSMNFGEPSLDAREPYESHSTSAAAQRIAARRRVTVRGQWWLWFYLCYWRLSLPEERAVTGSSSKNAIGRALAELDGQKLVSIAVHPKTGATRFTFDLGAELTCRRMEKDSSAEVWLLYQPDDNVLAVHGNGICVNEPASR